MHAIGIATDSHASLPPDVAKQLNIRILPMPFTIDGQDYLEGVDLTREEFFARQAAGADIATSQPSPSTVMALWDEMLLTHEQILYMPISSGLSGSCSTATALAQDEPYLGRVFVVDNGRGASPLYQSILDARYLEEKGLTAPQIKAALDMTDQWLGDVVTAMEAAGVYEQTNFVIISAESMRKMNDKLAGIQKKFVAAAQEYLKKGRELQLAEGVHI